MHFLRIDAVFIDQDLFAGRGEHDDRARRRTDRARRRSRCSGDGIGQHGVQRDDDGLAYERDEVDDPGAVVAAEETVLMLDVERIARMRVDEPCDRAVRLAIVLNEVGDDGSRIGARRGSGLFDRDDLTMRDRSAVVTVDDVFGERRDPAFAGRVRTEEEHPRCVHERSPNVRHGRPVNVGKAPNYPTIRGQPCVRSLYAGLYPSQSTAQTAVTWELGCGRLRRPRRSARRSRRGR